MYGGCVLSDHGLLVKASSKEICEEISFLLRFKAN